MNNTFSSAYQQFKKLIDYSPPEDPDPFVLDETRPDDAAPSGKRQDAAEDSGEYLMATVEFARRLSMYMEKVGSAVEAGSLVSDIDNFKAELTVLEKQWGELSPIIYSYAQEQDDSDSPISTSLEENEKHLQSIYVVPRNRDLVIRHIETGATSTPALIVYIDGLVNGQKLDQFVLQPLMVYKDKVYDSDTIGLLMKKVLPNGQARRVSTFKNLEEAVNDGDTAIIIDGIGETIAVETKGWEHRGVNTPQTEQTIRGSLAAFSENLRTNTGLVRSILRSSDLVTEMIRIGQRGQLNCGLMYIDSIANTSLVNEVRRRLKGLDTDYISDSGNLVQFIDDYPQSLFPQTLSTERPDRVAAHLSEGRLAIILEGSPFAQILPASFFSFFHSGEDFSLQPGVSIFMRILRLFGTLISTVLPSLYLSLSYFHPEAMPTELLLAIAGSRENVPFPAWFEVFVMEVSFELIREAGVRIPGILGTTIGIVGAIILGQAAVAAKLVSPIVVVIIAITGLASFTIPEYRMASAVRITRFILLAVSTLTGLVGLAMSLLILTTLLCGMKSYGVPYMTPIAPRTRANHDVVIRGQAFNQDMRPDDLGTKDRRRQPTISRIWKKRPPKEGDSAE